MTVFFSSDSFDPVLPPTNLNRDVCFTTLQKDYHKALSLYKKMEGHEGILSCVLDLEKIGNRYAAESLIPTYFTSVINYHDNQFELWVKEKNYFNVPPCLDFCCVAGAAFDHAKNYDIGIAVAKGGLSAAYIFELFGLPIAIAEWHRYRGHEAVEWRDNFLPETLRGKKVVVLEDVVETGMTAEKLYDTIQIYRPNLIDIFTSEIEENISCINLNNVPPLYGKHIDQRSVSFSTIIEASKNLQKRMLTETDSSQL